MTQWWDSSDGVLCLFPEWFAPRQIDWPDRLYQTDFPLFDPIPPASEPHPALHEFLANGRAPLVFTAGSAMGCPGDFFTKAAAVTLALKQRAVFVTAYPDKLPHNLPASILPVSYVPFHALFPRAAAVIHHGGIGTTAQALAAGVPQLILPISHDQPDNAERIVRLGCGRTLPRGQRRERNLILALRELLDYPTYREKATHLARMLPPPGDSSSAESALAAIAGFLKEWRK
jgi:rhamnosyltransferase subunit B